MKSKDLQPRFLHSRRLSFDIQREIKSFPDKKKLKEFNTKPVLQQMLKDLLEEEEEGKEKQTYKIKQKTQIK